jgi:hypothetical protein
MNYFEITEHNDWEGEIWTFFLQETGNEKFIEKLRKAIKKFNIDPEDFEVKDELASEKEVNLLVKRARSGYLPRFNKIDRILDPKRIQLASQNKFFDCYYKGSLFDK